jgi:pimeloyl-ACP methyl ester carboxylesterase
MSSPSPLSRTISTSRGRTRLLSSGDAAGPPVVFIHGNVSSAAFFAETLTALPPRFHALALDLRGFGDAEARRVDATRGVRDFSDDLRALLLHPDVGVEGRKVHLVGWSVGGGVAMQYAIDHAGDVASLTLLAPMSPYGFGGTRDAAGAPCSPDYTGSGGATANAEFKRRLAEKDASEESDVSPRKLMNQFYFKPPFRLDRAREDVLVEEMLKIAVGDDNYPGDTATSALWPGVSPATRGVNNAISPRYTNLAGFSRIDPRPDVLWIRGADDAIVSDTSLFDLGFLGQLGAVPGWPGAEVYPPQPMIAQMRAVLDAYRTAGGRVREEVLPGVGHSPHIEAPEAFLGLLTAFLDGR